MLPDPIDSTQPPEPPLISSPPAQKISVAARATAALEVIACSGYPTQFVLLTLFESFGLRPTTAAGGLNMTFVVAVSLLDAVLLVALIFAFLYAHGDRPREVFLGTRSIGDEAAHGVPLILIALAIAIVTLGSIQTFAPWLHTVPENPLGNMIRSPRDAWIFALVAIVAGAVREELQRAFLLHRFQGWLGGGTVGVIVTSASFGAGHAVQGADAMIATALLGLLWAIVYLRRRSVVAPMVSHAGFDLMNIVQFLYTAR